MMVLVAILSAAGLAASGVAAEAPKSLDSAGDVKGLVTELRKDATEAKLTAQVSAMNMQMDIDCETVEFKETTGKRSDPKDLFSRTWLEDCRPMGDPRWGCIPERRLLRTDQATAVVEITDRRTPGPKEKFRVCLRGPWLDLSVLSSPYKYTWTEKDGLFTLKRKS